MSRPPAQNEASERLAAQAKELREQARLVLEKMRVGARRAYVLELTGTPKSGKTTTLGVLERFFKASGFSVYTLRERAADCPLPMKGHFFFNAWTTCTMLAEVLQSFEEKYNLLILDRGFFDSLIWLEFQSTRRQVNDDEAKKFADFVLLERWRKLVDTTLVMTADPAVAMARENANSLLPRRNASLMNPTSLKEFNKAVSDAEAKYRRHFDIIKRNTSASRNTPDMLKSCTGIISELLPRMERWADREIMVLPRDRVTNAFRSLRLPPGKPRPTTPSRRRFDPEEQCLIAGKRARSTARSLASHARRMSRYAAEKASDRVQLVACGIVVHEQRIFVFSRSSSDEKVTRYGRTVIWKGVHIENGGRFNLEHAARSVKARLQEELHLQVELEPQFLGLVWARNSVDPGHLGIMFRVPVEQSVAESLQDKEFRKAGRGHTQVGHFHSQEELITNQESLDLEPWSWHIIRNLEIGR